MKKKPKIEIEFVKETINFPEFVEEILELIDKNKIPKKVENKKLEKVLK